MSASHVLFVTTSVAHVQPIVVKSPAFRNREMIPKKHTGDGANVNPALHLDKIPDETKSMVLIVEDPNAPVDTWVHWLVWDIMPTTKINENTIPGVEGLNAFRRHHYHGPCPPAGTRHYVFKIYALNTVLNMHFNSSKYEIMKAMKDHVVGYGELTGIYSGQPMAHVQHEAAPDIYA
jgi:Raf kinase inhibitor-like YbhB/YbcL family protein